MTFIFRYSHKENTDMFNWFHNESSCIHFDAEWSRILHACAYPSPRSREGQTTWLSPTNRLFETAVQCAYASARRTLDRRRQEDGWSPVSVCSEPPNTKRTEMSEEKPKVRHRGSHGGSSVLTTGSGCCKIASEMCNLQACVCTFLQIGAVLGFAKWMRTRTSIRILNERGCTIEMGINQNYLAANVVLYLCINNLL